MCRFPRVVKIKQRFDTPKLDDVEGRVEAEIAKVRDRIRPAARIAVAVGSRGIRNLQKIVATVVNKIKEAGGEPFIIPAMGSHGGATVEGQKEVLASYGITEDALGVPVVSNMATVQIGETARGIPVFFDRVAAEADGIVVINRVKPHTDFHGRVESGLLKMLAIGLGKQKGAEMIHSYGIAGLRELIPQAANVILKKMPVLFGLAILENAEDDTADIVALRAEEIEAQEPVLLERARLLMPRLPVQRLDVLVVEEMGKNISGVGLDPNITGRIGIRQQRDAEAPIISRVVVLDLTEESHGNALGMGLADVITRRFRNKVDLSTTYANVITSGFLERGFIPLVMPSDQEAIDLALRTCGRRVEPATARLMLIKNTLELGELYVSTALLPEVEQNPQVEILEGPVPLIFNEDGELIIRI
ncbi:lactate racemase domain-containing protein [Calderihabitans maritimus]|uniref:LarA-like N-terminal domain-containing protein n=1 Tax=Calderihabitans maritimus TaxID=1246530 RepID=A0A1Z5HWJ6_9FIRM|nr:lactate racemase domain-containing protein [Calderihabitans maritimus]GAW93788.1 hypothetical protein KKC1_29150 [Calderihabitans maritimus]